MDYEATDKYALKRSLLALHICPNCRADLNPAAPYWGDDVWVCRPCHESWYLPADVTAEGW